MAKAESFFSRGRKVRTTERFVTDLARNGLIMQEAGSSDGAEWIVDGDPLRNFGSCSYLGLGTHPDLIAGAETALRTFGSNFSISRAYLQCPLYSELESELGAIMGGRHVLVTQSTTMAHLAALPVLVGDNDLVLIDQFAHASMHMATDLIDDVPIELIRHSRVDALEQRLLEAGDTFERIWYLCDGVYSMLGDLAPFAELGDLLARYPQLHLYIDDAHGMSWTGRHGCGPAVAELGASARVVIAVSLSKAFGAAGGALAFPTAELRERVQYCGGPMIFSGPLAPAALGAGVAAAKLHQRPEFEDMQAELYERIQFTRERLARVGLVPTTDDLTPIVMIQYDSAETAVDTVRSLRERGFYCCVSTFPAVPINKPSIRFTLNRHNSRDDIAALVDHLATTVVVRS